MKHCERKLWLSLPKRANEMRKQKIHDDVRIRAGLLTTESLEILETVCKGSIKGIKLPRSERCIDFYQDNQEYRIEMGEYLVEFSSPREGSYFQVWSKENFRKVFFDADPIPY